MSNEKTIAACATQIGERFESPRPAYKAPTNPELTTPKKKESSGDKLAALIAKAEESAQASIVRAEAKREGRPDPTAKPRAPKKSAEPATITVQVGHFTEDDVCPDARTFIVRTRSIDIHTPEMKALFWANGGEAYMKSGLGYAAAFSNLRNDKIKSIQRK